MSKNYFNKIILFILLWGMITSSNAAKIEYNTTNISGNKWENNYTVFNNALGSDIEEFSIFFDLGLYENITLGITPVNWDSLIFQPDPAIPDDGIYDSLALTSGISAGNSLSGFSVQFDFLGIGNPGSQYFEIIDPSIFSIVESGNTTRSFIQPVPEPGILWLLSSIIFYIAFNKRKGLMNLIY